MNDQSKNTLLAIVLSVAVLIAWQYFFINPKIEAERLAAEREAQMQSEQAAQNGQLQGGGATASGDLPGVSASGDIPGAAPVVPGVNPLGVTREAAIADGTRLAFDNTQIHGSINLRGGRVDDITLKNYRETIDRTSPEVVLLSPSQTENGYFAEFGYSAPAGGEVPGPQTDWRSVGASTLTPQTPVTLEWTNGDGVTFRRTISVDDNYLFIYSDTVVNASGAPVTIAPYGRITRFGTPVTANIFVLHEGLIGVFGEEGLQEVDYDDVEESSTIPGPTSTSGWLGITDKYWATAMIPDGQFTPRFAYFDDGRSRYQSDFLGETVTIAAGGEAQFTQKLFAGAKKEELIDQYMQEHDILSFDLMIDWGWFYFITKPLFQLMNWLYKMVGNFGVAILITTVLIKAALFPLANMSYASMAKMKKVQPDMERIKQEAGDDRVKMQQEMMALYKREKINPAAGCWPILIQIPIFFALYKVIYVTIEMRHAPFFGWIQDLSAPDPTSIFNLFGLLPWDVPAILLVGIWPLIMGVTMFLQMQMNPTPPDPTQQMIFKWMPVVFTFMLATFPAGLVIYWAWNNFLSILQQGLIMKKHGVKIELWDNLKSMFSRKAKDSAAE